MPAHQHVIDLQLGPQAVVHGFDDLPRKRSACDVGLVGDDDAN
jgi:hypothetical protein